MLPSVIIGDKCHNQVVTGWAIGRESELAAIGQLLDGVGDGAAVLALWGEAGVGKTTLWEAGVSAAESQEYAVLACRVAAAEVRLSYVGLADLLAKVDTEGFAELPPIQQRGLNAALLRNVDDEGAPELRAVAAGFLTVLETLAGRTPVLLALDDVQWLDESTRRVVAFAVRRCSGPVAVLTAGRDGERSDFRDDLCPRDAERLRQVQVGPLNLDALHQVLMRHLGRPFPRPVLLRIVEVSGGNPFFALEIARSLDTHGVGVAAFPDSLRTLVQERIGALAPRVRDGLLVVSTLAVPRLDLVGHACGGVDAAELLGSAEDAGVVRMSAGRVGFTHPLLARGVYTGASPTSRRALHRRLSDLVEDAEERARHLALAATGPDADTVAALDAGAVHARHRGAPMAAAELLELAIDLGADAPTRRIQAAQDHFNAGDPARARELLDNAIAELPPGPIRADALGLLGSILYQVHGRDEAVEALKRAFNEARPDSRLASSVALELGVALTYGGRVHEALSYIDVAVEKAEHLDDRSLLAEALGCRTFVRFISGQGLDEVTLGRALALEEPDRPSHTNRWPSLHATLIYLWSHRLDEARAGLANLRQRCLDRGEESGAWLVSFQATTAACWCGDIDAAERVAGELVQRAHMLGDELPRAMALTAQAYVRAWTGKVDEARSAAEEASRIYARVGIVAGSLFAINVLGMLEMSIGNHEAAAGWLAPAALSMTAVGFVEPTLAPILPDAAEALIALGRTVEAEELVAVLEASGRQRGRAWAEAVGWRGRGLLLAAQRRLDEALTAFERALSAHDRSPLRYDRARTLLSLGRLQRRRNERRAAKASLEEAIHLFGAVGAAGWVDNTRAELVRLGLHAGPTDKLTPTEERVAELAATGSTNRMVATALAISPKTVEANLSRVYRKLGIQSRAELGTWLATRQAKGGASAT